MTIDAACPHCAQQPGEPCLDMPFQSYHAERVLASTFRNSLRPGVPPSRDEFDNAIVRKLGY